MRIPRAPEATISNGRGSIVMRRKLRFEFLRHPGGALLLSALLLACGSLFAAAPRPQNAQQITYSSPDDALQGLVSAARDKDRSAMSKVFGPD